jgi:TolA-binding protein
LKKDLTEHITECPSIELICADCKITYKRRDAGELHADVICVTKQLDQCNIKIEELSGTLEGNAKQHQNTMAELHRIYEMRKQKRAKAEIPPGNLNARLSSITFEDDIVIRSRSP